VEGGTAGYHSEAICRRRPAAPDDDQAAAACAATNPAAALRRPDRDSDQRHGSRTWATVGARQARICGDTFDQVAGRRMAGWIGLVVA
jgi:hypothetical protein